MPGGDGLDPGLDLTALRAVRGRRSDGAAVLAQIAADALEASAGCGVVDAYVMRAQARHDLLHIAAPSCTYTTHVPVDMDRVTLAPRPQWRERAALVEAELHEARIEIEMAEGRVRVLRTQTTESGRDTGRPDLG